MSFQVLICRTCRTLFCHITFNKLELPYLIIEYKDRKSCQVSILPNSFGGIYLVLARAAFREGCFSWWTEFWIWWSGMWLNSIFWIDNCLLFFLILQAMESSKFCNLIRSESGQFFMILPANLGGIVGSFIHKFVCCLWMSKTGGF